MPLNTVSNRKLHCCLAALILFILIFLSIPLLLIWVANNHYEELQNELTGPGPGGRTPSGTLMASNQTGPTESSIVSTSSQSPSVSSVNSNSTISPNQQLPDINCTQFAAQANLSLADENLRCPIGTFPCQSCPDICIEQRRNCDSIADCPDRSDESYCHDSNGAIGHIFKNIIHLQSIKKDKQLSSVSNSSLAKPESCPMDLFVNELCPCVYTDPRVIICDNLELTSVPNTLLSSVYKIRMSNNSISSLDNVFWPRSLTSLVLVNNRVTRIANFTFQSTPNLSKIYLSHNEIAHIDSEAFAGLTRLTSLQIESNKLQTFDSRILRHTPAIMKIYLSENMIDLPEETRFGQSENLKELLLDHNRISIIRAHWFSNMTSLLWLSLTHNEISVIEDGSFDWDYELDELNLSFNKIKVINRQMFASRLNIQRLYLGGNPLEPLAEDAFSEITHLRSLNLTHVDFSYIKRDTFRNLKQLEFIYFEKFRYCHYATHVRVCRPLTDGLSSVEELLAFPTLKYAVWIVASVCSLGNVFVFVWRTVSPHEDQTLSLFVKNLSIADLLMGIYLGAIGWQNFKFRHNFRAYAIEWMSSWTCTTIGFLAILSSELSVFILTIITIERYRSIISNCSADKETLKRRARIYLVLAWIFSTLIASYPLIEWMLSKSDYYAATNGLCLPLHIDQPFTPGWQYSAFIYLGINFSAVMIIIVLYVHMYLMIMTNRQLTRPVLFKAEKHEDAILAIRFFFIVITDCLCWIPIVVIKIMALAQVQVSSAIYGWLVVFVIPINSAINPIVYTLAAPTSLRAAACKLFERICHKVDMLTSGGSNYSSQSSSAGSANLEPHVIVTTGRRRRNTCGSNSTITCDTFDTSIATQCSKTSVESAFSQSTNSDFHRRHYDMVVNIQAKFGPSKKSLTKNTAPSTDSPQMIAEIDKNLANTGNNPIGKDGDGNEFYRRFSHLNSASRGNQLSGCTMTPATMMIRPHDCLSSNEDNPIEQRVVNGKAQDRDRPIIGSIAHLRNDRHRSRRLVAYDSLERRTSFNGQGQSGKNGIRQQASTIGFVYNKARLSIRRATNPIDEDKAAEMVMRMQVGANDSRGSDSESSLKFTTNLDANDSHASLNELGSDLGSANKIDLQATINQQNRVSFSSKDSRTCLLSQNDPC